MSVDPRRPGVVVIDPSPAPRTVVPATTASTAFLGEFAEGSTSEAVHVDSWADFTRRCGDLDARSSRAAYAVHQFFRNGGVDAWIVRLAAPGSATAAVTIPSPAAEGGAVTLTAADVGAWGDTLAAAFVPSPGSDRHVDLVLTRGTGAAAATEAVTNLPLTHPDGVTATTTAELAALVTEQAAWVTAAAADPGAPVDLLRPAPLTGGADGQFDDTSLAAAVTAALASNRLDAIAPETFDVLCVPDLVWDPATFALAHAFCADRSALLLVDAPGPDAVDPQHLQTWADTLGRPAHSAVVHHPWLLIEDPVTTGTTLVPPSGTVAGVYATNDASRGVWRAPAGVGTPVVGVVAPAVPIDDTDTADLAATGINPIRAFPLHGPVLWGARTFTDRAVSPDGYAYVATRRLADFLTRSLRQSLRWTVVEPNDATLWSAVTTEVTTFLSGLFVRGAFAGRTADRSYFVRCGPSTTSAADLAAGRLDVVVGFAATTPGEFVPVTVTVSAVPPS